MHSGLRFTDLTSSFKENENLNQKLEMGFFNSDG